MVTLAALFIAATNFYNLPPGLLASLCFVESKYDINAIHHDDGGSDSLGVCQIKLETAKWIGFHGTKEELMQPVNNIGFAAGYLRIQLHRYHGDVTKAVIAYNKGNAKRLTTTSYQRKVFKEWRQHAISSD